jgi:uncharacterized protein DUF6259
VPQNSVILENENLYLDFDEWGHIIAFQNKATGTSFLTYPGLENNWKLLVLGEGHPVYYIHGREQKPVGMKRFQNGVTFSYRKLVAQGITYNIDLDFSAYLAGDEARFEVTVANHHTHRIREVWYPILGGFEGFELDGQKHRVDLALSRTLAPDILHKGLPNAEYLFVVEGETAHYVYPNNMQMQWIDLFCAHEGLYISSDDKSLQTTVFRLEKYPPEAGSSGLPFEEPCLYPPDTPRWMNMAIGRLTAIDPGEEWQSAPGVFWPHKGDWHVAAKHYRAWADTWITRPERPKWLKEYVGWQHIIGKTYLGEIYYRFDDYLDIMKKAQTTCGVDTLMLYGHTNIGCEGSDYDISPAVDMGGKEGFRQLCDVMHHHNMKVMVFTHRQSAINMDLPEYKRFEKWAITDRLGRPRTEVWWKTTIESLMQTPRGHYEATGPVWARVCPHCDEWWDGFLSEIKSLMELGLDGIQLDTIGVEGEFCYASNHGHKPGTGQMLKLAERLDWLRRELRAINPEFMVCGEEYGDWLSQYLDVPLSRYRVEEGNEVYRFTFPDNMENCAVSAYGYHQANKSLLLGMGMMFEIVGIKKTILECPELADYCGQIVKIRRAFSDYLINGRFMDTLQAEVSGAPRYSVFEGPRGLAAVLWNHTHDAQPCTLAFAQSNLKRGTLCQPYTEWQQVDLPLRLTLQPESVAVVVAEYL